jgi:methyl-accepting chemotaxis protein
VGEIAAASQEQAQGIEQSNRAISEMNRIVQSNAASAEESAAASEEMYGQAEFMKSTVSNLSLLIAGLKGRPGTGSRKRADGAPVLAASREKSPVRTLALERKDRKSRASQAGDRARIVPPDQVMPSAKEDFRDF